MYKAGVHICMWMQCKCKWGMWKWEKCWWGHAAEAQRAAFVYVVNINVWWTAECYLFVVGTSKIKMFSMLGVRLKLGPYLYTNANKASGTAANPNECPESGLFGIRPGSKWGSVSLVFVMYLIYHGFILPFQRGKIYVHVSTIANVFFFEVPTPNT